MEKTLGYIFLHYLRFLAKLQLAKIKFLLKLSGEKLTIVGITGSAGKTSTLLAASAALTPNFKIKTNDGYNSESGLPLSILDLKISNYTPISWLKIAFLSPLKLLTNWQTYQVLILEMGIDSPVYPKNMDFLLSIVKPNIGIFLNITPVHLFNFQNIDEIAKEKAKLVNTAETAIINSSDPLVKKYTTNQNIVSITPTPISFPNIYTPQIYNNSFGAAIALGVTLGLDKITITNNIKKNFSLPPSRASILKGIKNSTIIDSSYNSSPLACTELLKFLATFKTKKIAVLGDMRELGKSTKTEHQKIYDLATKSADLIISIGPETQKYFGNKSQKFTYWWQAAEFLKNIIKNKETILIKGSQNTIYLEELVKELIPTDKLKNYLSDNLICRQSEYWLRTKNKFKKENSS